QGNDHRGDDGSADVSEEHEQHGDDENGSFQEVLFDRGDGLVDEHGPVIDGNSLDARRQRLVDDLHLLVDGSGDRTAVLAEQHEDCAEHDFLPVLRCRATSELTPQANFCNVTDADRQSLRGAYDDLIEVLDAPHLSGRPDKVLLPASFDVARTDVGVVALERRYHVLQAQAVRGQLLEIRCDLELTLEAANRVDFGNARHISQLRLDDPVLDFPEVRGRIQR